MEHWVTPEEDGRKLRDVLRRAMGVSYTALKSAKWDDRIRVNGVPEPVSRIVHAGETITFLPAPEQPVYQVTPYALPLTIPFEDEHLLVVDKPAPLASQSSLGHPDDSLENAVYSYLGCPEGFIYRPVNRLDKGTSGLMAVAKNSHAQHRLQQLLHTPQFRRIYLAVTDGVPPQASGLIDAPIAKADEASIRRIVTAEGKPSQTYYEVLDAKNGRALVRLELATGRTHQIRVHMSHIGCPVFGDFLYGTESPELPGRFALHSAEVLLTHPITGEKLHLVSPLPPALSALLDGSPVPASPDPAAAGRPDERR